MDINDLKAKYDECMSRTSCNDPCIKCDLDMPSDVWDAMGVIDEYLEEMNKEGE